MTGIKLTAVATAAISMTTLAMFLAPPPLGTPPALAAPQPGDGGLRTDLYFARSDPSGQYPLGWEHIHRDARSVVHEDYLRYPDGAFVYTKKSFSYDAAGRLKTFACSTNAPADITADGELAFGDSMAAQVAIPGLSKVVTMPGFTLQAELDLNRWARTAKPGDTHSFKVFRCLKATVSDCTAHALGTTRMLVDTRELNGLKIGIDCPAVHERHIAWFDENGNEIATLRDDVMGMRDE